MTHKYPMSLQRSNLLRTLVLTSSHPEIVATTNKFTLNGLGLVARSASKTSL